MAIKQLKIWKRILSKLTSVLRLKPSSPITSMTRFVITGPASRLRRVLQAWAEIELNNHGTPHD
jgi:hypothetical protein